MLDVSISKVSDMNRVKTFFELLITMVLGHLPVIKNVFSLVLVALALSTTKDPHYALFSLLELLGIFCVSNWLAGKNGMLANVVSGILYILFNVQMLVLFFGSTFIQMVMISNLESIQDLAGKAVEYGTGAVLLALFSFLPVRHIDFPELFGEGFFNSDVYQGEHSKGHRPSHYADDAGHQKALTKGARLTYFGLTAALLLYFSVLSAFGTAYSPTFAYFNLGQQIFRMRTLKASVSSADDIAANKFFSADLTQGRKKDSKLKSKPNVILVFAEGLSQNIVFDRDGALMPNLKELELDSVNFTNYYNHTFATYRGLIGQLYSGYQLDNMDTNSLISIQDVFSSYDYKTEFINTEPANSDFTEYLNSLNFDEVVGSTDDARMGAVASYSDKQAFEMLFDEATRLDEEGQSFFLSMYTFGTHTTLESVDEHLSDSSTAFEDKFYNFDCQLGTFLQKFNESPLADNTVLVFTSDHATYQDNDFTTTFPNYARASSNVDSIPFCIYYKGVKPETIDVQGRNSLDLAPTVLDYLDMSAPNYFLGTSLFASNAGNLLDTVFCEEAVYLSTNLARVVDINPNTLIKVQADIEDYYAAKASTNNVTLKSDDSDSASEDEELWKKSKGKITTKKLSGNKQLQVSYEPADSVERVWFLVWSSEGKDDDLQSYEAELNDDGQWTCTIDLEPHTLSGELNIHAYTGADEPSDFLSYAVTIV